MNRVVKFHATGLKEKRLTYGKDKFRLSEMIYGNMNAIALDSAKGC